MREILFKAVKIYGTGWVEGDLIHGISGNIYISTLDSPFLYLVIPETVCQYTGLKDKNGNRIFEGDKLTSDSILFAKRVIMSKEDVVGFELHNYYKDSKRFRYTISDIDPEDIENMTVIGNIHGHYIIAKSITNENH